VYVAERSGCPDQFVLQCLYDSAVGDVKRAMLTRLDSRRAGAMRHAWEQVAFASEYETSTRHSGGRQGTVARSGNGGHMFQGGRGQGFVAHVGLPTTGPIESAATPGI
jgi:hypothetical protein